MYGKDDPRVADVLDNLAINLERWALDDKGEAARQKRAEARALGERALAIREATLGKDHPAVAHSLQNLVGLVDGEGKRQEARAMLQRALAIKEAAFGPDHVELTATLNNLADFDEDEGHLEAALAGYQRSLALQTRATGESPQLAFALLAVAEVQDALDHPAEAAAAFRHLAAVRTKPAGKQGAAVRAALAEVATGAPQGPARQELTEILAAQRDALAPEDPHRAPALIAAARLDLAAGAADAAATRIELAAKIIAADPQSEPPTRAELEITRGELLKLRGDRAAAHAAATRAEAICPGHDCKTPGYALARRVARLRM
jgi:eukaryotic-like serine/threonine-protein kinase